MYRAKAVEKITDRLVGNLRKPSGMAGIDISHWQKGIDLEAALMVEKQDFLILRSSVGSDFKDKQIHNYADQLKKLKDKGIDPFLGFYHFSTLANTKPTFRGIKEDARSEAENFVLTTELHFKDAWEDGNMLPWLDMELVSHAKRTRDSQFKDKAGDQLSASQTIDFFLDWQYRVGELTGRTLSGVYTGKWFWLSKQRGFGGSSDLFNNPLWAASYGKKPREMITKDGEEWLPDIWQYTGSGKLPGVKGKIDRNVTRCSAYKFGQLLNYKTLDQFEDDSRFEKFWETPFKQRLAILSELNKEQVLLDSKNLA